MLLGDLKRENCLGDENNMNLVSIFIFGISFFIIFNIYVYRC